MVGPTSEFCIAFEGDRRIASGDIQHVALKTKEIIDRQHRNPVLIFDGATSELIEIDFRGTAADVERRLSVPSGESEPPVSSAELGGERSRGPGRPKLGVVAREVTLLPRHWEWLGSQPGGASVALRKLVEEARRQNISKDRVRIAREAAYRFMSAMAGNLPDFEEASRALFAGDHDRLDQLVDDWPNDIRDHVRRLVENVSIDDERI